MILDSPNGSSVLRIFVPSWPVTRLWNREVCWRAPLCTLLSLATQAYTQKRQVFVSTLKADQDSTRYCSTYILPLCWHLLLCHWSQRTETSESCFSCQVLEEETGQKWRNGSLPWCWNNEAQMAVFHSLKICTKIFHRYKCRQLTLSWSCDQDHVFEEQM